MPSDTPLGSLLPNAEQQFCDANGVPLAAGSVSFYVINTLTPKNVFSDPGLTVSLGNVVTLDAAGRAIIYGNGQYRQIVKDVFGNTIWDQVTDGGPQLVTGGAITPQAYGALGNGFIADDGGIIGGQKAFSSASANFSVATDIGKSIAVIGAGAAGATLLTTVTGVTNSTNVTLNIAASTTVTNAHWAFGTDDSAALAAFFTANVNQSVAFQPSAIYISTTKQTSQVRRLNANSCAMVFMIPNNTDNCLTVVPPVPALGSELASRMIYQGLWVDAMATGQDEMFCNDGHPMFYDGVWDYSYRDAIFLESASGVAGANTFIENYTNYNGVIRHCGRHAHHLYLLGQGNATDFAFINESAIQGLNIRGVGQRFASGNALRLTFDNCKPTSATGCKISNTHIIGSNWDGDQANTLGGNSLSNPVFVEVLNGSTTKRVEFMEFIGTHGVESTTGVVSTSLMFIDGTNVQPGDFIGCDFSDTIFNWGIGVPTNVLSSVSGSIAGAGAGNVFRSTNNRYVVPQVIAARPGDATGRSLISYAPFPNGPFIDPNFKNIASAYATLGTLVASENLVITIPLGLPANPVGNVNNTWQWPVVVILDQKPDSKTVVNWAYAEYRVQIAYQVSPGPAASGVNAILVVNVPSGNPSQTFAPNAVTFALTSSSGSLNDQLQVTIPGGANVGAGGINKLIDVIAYRAFSGGINEANHNYGAPGAQVNTGFGI